MELSSKIIFYIYISFLSIIGILQIFFLAIILYRETYKIFSILLKILIFQILIAVTTALAITIFYYITNKNYPQFYRDCPFNFDLSDINSIFNTSSNRNSFNYFSNHDKNNFDLKEKCKKKICIETKESNNIFSYYYICNFNSNYKDLIYCNKYIFQDINTDNSKILENYINICSSKTYFYLCQTNNKPTYYPIDSSYECPTKTSNSFTIGIILSIFNIIVPLIINIFQFIIYNKILKLIYLRDINASPSFNNKNTDNTSKIKENPSFEKQSSELIIVDNKLVKKEELFKIKIDKNNLKIKPYINSGIIMSMNHEISSQKENNASLYNKKNKQKIQKKNNSFSNFNDCRSSYLEKENIDLLNNIKIRTQNNFDKQENKNFNNSDEKSEIKFIKIKK